MAIWAARSRSRSVKSLNPSFPMKSPVRLPAWFSFPLSLSTNLVLHFLGRTKMLDFPLPAPAQNNSFCSSMLTLFHPPKPDISENSYRISITLDIPREDGDDTEPRMLSPLPPPAGGRSAFLETKPLRSHHPPKRNLPGSLPVHRTDARPHLAT